MKPQVKKFVLCADVDDDFSNYILLYNMTDCTFERLSLDPLAYDSKDWVPGRGLHIHTVSTLGRTYKILDIWDEV
jgi:hypothetical protein